jgi:hypothetical protein
MPELGLVVAHSVSGEVAGGKDDDPKQYLKHSGSLSQCSKKRDTHKVGILPLVREWSGKSHVNIADRNGLRQSRRPDDTPLSLLVAAALRLPGPQMSTRIDGTPEPFIHRKTNAELI